MNKPTPAIRPSSNNNEKGDRKSLNKNIKIYVLFGLQYHHVYAFRSEVSLAGSPVSYHCLRTLIERNGGGTLWWKQENGVNLPWFPAQFQTDFHRTVTVTFLLSSIFKIPTEESRYYAVVSTDQLHCDVVSTSREVQTSEKLHSSKRTETPQRVSHVTGAETSSRLSG